MYEVFDAYLKHETWSSNHDLDRERFLVALASVVREDGFNPDEMGRYMRGQKGVRDDNRNEGYAHKIDHDVQDAWAVRDFIMLSTKHGLILTDA